MAHSESDAWQAWSQKWGDWTTWFRKDVPLESLQRGLILPPIAMTGEQNVRTGRERLTPDQRSADPGFDK